MNNTVYFQYAQHKGKFFYENEISSSLPHHATAVTWDTWVSPDVEYARLLIDDQDIGDLCPDHLVERQKEAENLLRGHLDALKQCKIHSPHVESIPSFVIENIH